MVFDFFQFCTGKLLAILKYWAHFDITLITKTLIKTKPLKIQPFGVCFLRSATGLSISISLNQALSYCILCCGGGCRACGSPCIFKILRGSKKIGNIFKMKILSKYMNLHIPAFCDTNLDLIFDICFRNFKFH